MKIVTFLYLFDHLLDYLTIICYWSFQQKNQIYSSTFLVLA